MATFHDLYKTLLGRNLYSQIYRQYVYSPRSNGKYYSDCSSSGCATFQKLGVDISLLNTAGMHYSDKKRIVDCGIDSNGHIKHVEMLQPGDCLMFRGTDPKRPLGIGHVEYIYEINGKTEEDILICGHGSGVPSIKVLSRYLTNRNALHNSNGTTRGLVEVLRFLPDENKPKEIYPKWVFNNGYWYYRQREGVNAHGWQDINGHRYYFDDAGKMFTDWHQINGKWYYFQPNSGAGVALAGALYHESAAKDGSLEIWHL